MSEMKIPNCEICGDPSVSGRRDLQEVPTKDESVMLEPRDGFHWFCLRHDRPSLILMLNGRLRNFE